MNLKRLAIVAVAGATTFYVVKLALTSRGLTAAGVTPADLELVTKKTEVSKAEFDRLTQVRAAIDTAKQSAQAGSFVAGAVALAVAWRLTKGVA